MVQLGAGSSHKCKANVEKLSRGPGMNHPLRGIALPFSEGIPPSYSLQGDIFVKRFLNVFLAAVVCSDVQNLYYLIQEKLKSGVSI